MNAGTYFNFHHTAEIYKKITTTNAAGQRLFTYELHQVVPAIMQSRTQQYSGGTLIRTAPYQDYISSIELIVPAKYSNYIQLSSRVQNIADRNQIEIDAGPFEIISIHPKFGFGGKKHHVIAQLRYVVENV